MDDALLASTLHIDQIENLQCTKFCLPNVISSFIAPRNNLPRFIKKREQGGEKVFLLISRTLPKQPVTCWATQKGSQAPRYLIKSWH